jgi:hypothetical protein
VAGLYTPPTWVTNEEVLTVSSNDALPAVLDVRRLLGGARAGRGSSLAATELPVGAEVSGQHFDSMPHLPLGVPLRDVGDGVGIHQREDLRK